MRKRLEKLVAFLYIIQFRFTLCSSQAFYYPPKAGYPIGMADSPKQYMLEMHYDNPEGIEGLYKVQHEIYYLFVYFIADASSMREDFVTPFFSICKIFTLNNVKVSFKVKLLILRLAAKEQKSIFGGEYNNF